MISPEQHLLEAVARRVESVPASIQRCAALWHELVSGHGAIVHAFTHERRSGLVLEARAERVSPLDAQALAMLERTLLGHSRKVTAFEMNVSTSKLALTLKDSLATLGLRCRPSSVPMPFVILAHGACLSTVPCGMFIGDCEHAGRRFTVVTHAFDEATLSFLAPSERVVVSLLANGRSSADIAARRNRSRHTVTNQIAAACRRLGVSGRLELLHRVATLGACASRAR